MLKTGVSLIVKYIGLEFSFPDHGHHLRMAKFCYLSKLGEYQQIRLEWPDLLTFWVAISSLYVCSEATFLFWG